MQLKVCWLVDGKERRNQENGEAMKAAGEGKEEAVSES